MRKKAVPAFAITGTACSIYSPDSVFGRLCSHGRNERDSGLRGEQQKRESLPKIESDSSIAVDQVANGDVLADVQLEIATARGQYKSSIYSGRPNDFILD